MPDRVSPYRLVDVQRITDAAHDHLDLDGLLRDLIARISEVLEVDPVWIELDDERSGGRTAAGPGAATKTLLELPLRARGRTIGTLTVGSARRGSLDEEEQMVLELIADRAATAIENARLFEAEQRARQDAEAAARQLSDLQSVSDAALARLSLDDLLGELLDRVTAVLGVDTAAILLMEPSGDELRGRAARGLEEEAERRVRIPVGQGFAGLVAAERRPVAIDVDEFEVYNPLLREHGVKSLLGVPLLTDGDVLGVLHVGSLTKRDFDERETALLELVADRAAAAIGRARVYEREHAIAVTLQHSLLPSELVTLPGIEVAARYLAPAEAADVGGDWYDALALPDGRVAVSIGDVVGRGVEAAALMGQLRNGLRAYALEGHEPAEVGDLLNRIVRDGGPGATATMVYVVYAPDTGRATVMNAGHLPPVLVDPGGSARLVELTRSVPLGATRNTRYTVDEVELSPGSTLLLYTDGLVERPDEDLAAGLERLRAAAGTALGAAAGRCDAILDGLIGTHGSLDDVALLAFRPLELSERLHERFRAEPEAVPVMRRLLLRWLVAQGASEEIAHDVVVACSEACANAVEHAYGPVGEASFEVTGTVAGGHEVELAVADGGGWREPRGRHRGRGLMLMEAFMDSVQVECGESGTRVLMRRSLNERVAA